MTGKEIYGTIIAKNNNYVNLEEDNAEQPKMSLTSHQCFKLADHLGWQHRHYNNAMALGSGLINSFDFTSVRISTPKPEEV